MNASLLQVRDISIVRRGRALLDHVSFELEPRQHVTIVGPNGAGKTLLLKSILGLIRPDSGEITRKPGMTLGYMPQRMVPSPLMPLSVMGFLRLLKGVSAAQAEEALQLVDARMPAGTSIHSLSGGEWQRVLLARALLRKPDLLLLDEPGQNLDVPGQIALYELIRDVQLKSGCAVLMVSHDLHFVMRRTDRVLCLFHHVCCTGKPQEIVSEKAFTELFGDTIGEVIGFYPHHHTHTHDGPHHGSVDRS